MNLRRLLSTERIEQKTDQKTDQKTEQEIEHKNKQQVLVLYLASSALDSPVKGWSYYDGCCLLYTSPSPRDKRQSRMPSSA